LCGDWVAATATGTLNLFSLSCSTDSIIDVEVEYTLSNQIQAASITIATGVLGSIYYLPLDGAASHVYNPLHLPTTF
jgi:hypothetical protein